MGLSRVFGCFKDPDAQTSKKKKKKQQKQEQPRNQSPREVKERPNIVVPIPALEDKNHPTTRIETSSDLTHHTPEDLSGIDNVLPVLVATTAAGDYYEPEPWSMGSVARRTSHLTNRRSPSATSLAEKIFNIEFQAQQQGVIAREVPKEVRDYWAPLGTGIRVTDLLRLPTVDIKQFRSNGSGVAEGDEAEEVVVEPYIVPNRLGGPRLR
jgi:hypothetical protein